MFTIVCPDGTAVNFSNFDYWFVRKPKDRETYAVYAVRVYEVEKKEPHDLLSYFKILAQYATEKEAFQVLADINNSILAGERGYRMPSGVEEKETPT